MHKIRKYTVGVGLLAMACCCGALEVTFPDPALEAVVRKALDETTGALQAEDLAALEKLTVYQTEVRDLTGLEHCINLTNLNCQSNKIENIDALAQMPQLEWLFLNNNAITDIAPLAGLTKLDLLSLSGNPITSLAPLADLHALRHLSIIGLEARDLNAIAGLTNLEELAVDRMGLPDLEFVRDMTRLRRLSASQNEIRSLEPLRNLRGLAFIELDQNRISDISPLSKLVQVRRLDLSTNEITSVAGFPPLMPEAVVRLYWNQITDIQPLLRSCENSSGITLELGENPLATEAFCRDFPALEAGNNRAVFRYHTAADKVQLFPGIDLLCGNADNTKPADPRDSPTETAVVPQTPAPETTVMAAATAPAAPPAEGAAPENTTPSPNGESKALVAVTLADTEFNVSVASTGLDLRSLLGAIALLGVAVLLVIAWRIPKRL